MKTRLPSFPLITIDPFFSYWSGGDELNGVDVTHWSGHCDQLSGDVLIDGESFRFMGLGEKKIKQVDRNVSPMFTSYVFANEKIRLNVVFWSPAFLDDIVLASRPCSYMDVSYSSVDGKRHDVTIKVKMDESFAYDDIKDSLIVGDALTHKGLALSYLGKKRQPLLEYSGDDMRINWGYLLLASDEEGAISAFLGDERRHYLQLDAKLREAKERTIIFAYDDVASLNYFGRILQGLWLEKWPNIVTAIKAALLDHDANRKRALAFDERLLTKAEELGGEPYQEIITASYRQVVAGHKTLRDEGGKLLYVSKECFSNGCAATLDISYPSSPLFFYLNPELVLGMLRPIVKAARLPIWRFDFAPHDCGRYPILMGDVYGLAHKPSFRAEKKEGYPPFHYYHDESGCYDLGMQMPIEECGNALILSYYACHLLNDAAFLKENIDLLSKWALYLHKHGADPENQLCTDDFAGHSEHNCNLSLKAVMGIESYSRILEMLGEKEKGEKEHLFAKKMADDWRRRAECGDHTRFAFGVDEGWSLKYNAYWDLVFGSGLFGKEFFTKEVESYKAKMEKYGVPLDHRAQYVLTEWEVWVSSFSLSGEEREKFLKPIASYINEGAIRVPFGDWYDVDTGSRHQCYWGNNRFGGFQARTPQGGCFALFLLPSDD